MAAAGAASASASRDVASYIYLGLEDIADTIHMWVIILDKV